MKLHLPWPVVRQLSAWPIPGLIDWLNQFQGNRQPSGGGGIQWPLFLSYGLPFPTVQSVDYAGNFNIHTYPYRRIMYGVKLNGIWEKKKTFIMSGSKLSRG